MLSFFRKKFLHSTAPALFCCDRERMRCALISLPLYLLFSLQVGLACTSCCNDRLYFVRLCGLWLHCAGRGLWVVSGDRRYHFKDIMCFASCEFCVIVLYVHLECVRSGLSRWVRLLPIVPHGAVMHADTLPHISHCNELSQARVWLPDKNTSARIRMLSTKARL